MFLQLADARRHIGLNAREFVGGADDPALVDHGAEDFQGFQVDHSHGENDRSELFICASGSADPYSPRMRSDLTQKDEGDEREQRREGCRHHRRIAGHGRSACRGVSRSRLRGRSRRRARSGRSTMTQTSWRCRATLPTARRPSVSIAEGVARFGRIDTLINNAGVFVAKPFTQYTEADYAADARRQPDGLLSHHAARHRRDGEARQRPHRPDHDEPPSPTRTPTSPPCLPP